MSKKGAGFFGYFLPALIVLILGALAATVWIAVGHKSQLVRDDYYEAGLRQDALLAQFELARKVQFTLSLSKQNDSLIAQAQVMGKPLESPQIVLQLYRPDERGLDRILVLRATNAGRYVAEAKGVKPGLWEAHIVHPWKTDSLRVALKNLRFE